MIYKYILIVALSVAILIGVPTSHGMAQTENSTPLSGTSGESAETSSEASEAKPTKPKKKKRKKRKRKKRRKKKKKSKKSQKGEGEDAKTEEGSTTEEAAHPRGEKPIGLHLNYTPLSDFFLSYGANFSYNTSADFELNLSFLAGSKDLTETVKEDELLKPTATTASSMLVLLNTRFYFGNSFALTTGLGIRQANIQFGFEEKITNISVEATSSVLNTVGYIGIGNHWLLDGGFMLGCDWVALSVPFTSNSQFELKTTGLDNATIDSLELIMEDLNTAVGNISAVSLLITNIGMRF